MSEVNMNRVFRCCNKSETGYNKLKTSINDPSISKAHRLSQYLNSVNPSLHYENTTLYLHNKGLTYTPLTYNLPNFKQTFIYNDIIFPRERIFV